jgi:hypothetical protein
LPHTQFHTAQAFIRQDTGEALVAIYLLHAKFTVLDHLLARLRRVQQEFADVRPFSLDVGLVIIQAVTLRTNAVQNDFISLCF